MLRGVERIVLKLQKTALRREVDFAGRLESRILIKILTLSDHLEPEENIILYLDSLIEGRDKIRSINIRLIRKGARYIFSPRKINWFRESNLSVVQRKSCYKITTVLFSYIQILLKSKNKTLQTLVKKNRWTITFKSISITI